jgi:hypothetical protein
MKDETIKFVIIGIVALGIIFIVIAVMKKVGIIKSAAAKTVDTNVTAISTSDYFNPSYYKTAGTFKQLSDTECETYTKKLHKAFMNGSLSMAVGGTDEEAIYGVFALLSNKTQISQIAEAYYTLYNKRDFRTDLLNELTDKEVSKLYEIIEKLPKNS